MTVKWIPTSEKVYVALRVFHNDAMHVHGTITDLGEYTGSRHIMTEWALKGADYPLIKFDEHAGVISYWIAVVTKEEPES